MELDFTLEVDRIEIDFNFQTDMTLVSAPAVISNSDDSLLENVDAGASFEIPDTRLVLPSHEIEKPAGVSQNLKISDLIQGAPTPNMISATITISEVGDIPVAVAESEDYIFWVSSNWNVVHRYNKLTQSEDLSFTTTNVGTNCRGLVLTLDRLFIISTGNTRIGCYLLDGTFVKNVLVPSSVISGGIQLTDWGTLVVVSEYDDVMTVHEYQANDDLTFIRSTILVGHSVPVNTSGESLYGNKLVVTSPSYKPSGIMIFDLLSGNLIEEVDLNAFVGGAIFLDDNNLLWWPYGGNSGMGGAKIVETTNWTTLHEFAQQTRGIYRLVKGFSPNTFLTTGFNQFDHPHHRKNVVKHLLEL